MACAAVTVLLVLPAPAGVGLVYVALQDSVWRVYFQSRVEATPQSVTPTLKVGGDAGAPVLSADGNWVALEMGGKIIACPIGLARECRRAESPRGAIVRPAWQPLTGELVFAEYVADGKEEGADILTTRNGLSELVLLLAQTGVQDDPTFSRDGRLLAYTVAQTVSVHRAGVQVVQQIWVADMGTGLNQST